MIITSSMFVCASVCVMWVNSLPTHVQFTLAPHEEKKNVSRNTGIASSYCVKFSTQYLATLDIKVMYLVLKIGVDSFHKYGHI